MDKQEQAEWESVNRLLQHHGFKPVRFADPTENKNLAELSLVEKNSSAELRNTLRTMLSDSERRQNLIQELIQSNTKLKQEVEQQQVRVQRESSRAQELEVTLTGVKVKVQGLEDSLVSRAARQHAHVLQLQQEKKDAEKRCEALQQRLSEQTEQLSELQKKLHFAVKEQERRAARQNHSFQQICKRSAKPHTPHDQLILDVIDVYEHRIQQLQQKVNLQRRSASENDAADSPSARSTDAEISPSSNYRVLLKSYQEQLRKSKAQRDELKDQIQRLKRDLESRPTVKELKSCKQQLRRMDRLRQQSNIGPAAVETTETPSSEFHRTPDYQRCLQEICSELDVQDVELVLPTLKARCREADSAQTLQKALSEVSAVLTNPRAPLGLLRQPGEGRGLGEAVQPELVLATLEFWRQQLNLVPDLHRSVVRLMRRLLPWQQQEQEEEETRAGSRPDGVKVEDVMLLVDTLLDETAPDHQQLRSPTRHTLQAMVSHFQKLFDAPSLSGVYPRMNQLYTRLGETNNAMRNLRDVLQLDERAPPSEVVNTVARIVSSGAGFPDQDLQQLLGTSDIDSIIMKLREHEEFFPAFHSFVQELLHLLGIDSLDKVLPVVTSLKSKTY